MDRSILHVDLNNFYASVETLYCKELENTYMAVCGNVENRHGIILAKNQRAKEMGVKTGMTIGDAKRLCPNLLFVEAHHDRYIKYSKLVKAIFYEYTDEVESFGIDEAWLDVTHSKIFGSAEEIAHKIRKQVKADLGLTVSVGVSFNKVFAKLGSDMKKPDAVTVISQSNYKQLVWQLPVSDLLFVGKSTAKKLIKYNINTIGQLANSNKEFLKRMIGKWGETLHVYANGLDNSPVMKYGESDEVKSVGNSITSYRDLETLEDVEIVFSVLADSVSSRLLSYDIGKASTLSITIRDVDLFSFTRQGKLQKPSVLASDFFNRAIELFAQNYAWDKNIRSLGIQVSNFKVGNEQISMLGDDESYEKQLKLALTIENIRKKYGTLTVQKAVQYADKKLMRENPKETHIIFPDGKL